MGLLEAIKGPQDLKALSVRELYRLAAEIRLLIVETVTRNGGHLASNLGVVELTLALHAVFDSPRDSLVWDVGHQCYTHKLLTGRLPDFHRLRLRGGPSGFPKAAESEHDAFDAGHASTSISAALGLLEAKRMRGDSSSVVAIIGDGALTGGMAMEGLSHAGSLQRPLIIVLNDNKMSISPNVGALSRYLSRLSATVGYQNVRARIDRLLKAIPFLGGLIFQVVMRIKKGVKAIFFKENLFYNLGFEYVGPIDGHNIRTMIEVFREARAIGKPVVIHAVTKKGKGYELAEEDPTRYHGLSPLRVSDGKLEQRPGATFTEAFAGAMLRAGERDTRVVAITAAMAKGTGLSAFQKRFPKRFFDVGIAEEHAVTFAGGLAAGGMRPVVAIYSTFMQRVLDQVFHDVALRGLPVIFAVDRAGAVPDDGETHQGLYDISAFRSLPGLAILAPSTEAEVGKALDWALAADGPSLIRYPKGPCPKPPAALGAAFVAGKGVLVRDKGSDILIVSMGGLLENAMEAAADIGADLYSLRFVKPLDREGLRAVADRYRALLFLEEGCATGGIGESFCAYLREAIPGYPIRVMGFPEMPFAQASRPELLEAAGLSAHDIARAVAGLRLSSRRIFLSKAGS